MFAQLQAVSHVDAVEHAVKAFGGRIGCRSRRAYVDGCIKVVCSR